MFTGPIVPARATAGAIGAPRFGVHVGRVRSWRLDLVPSLDVDSVEGTYLAFGPDANGVRMTRWLRRLDTQPLLL